MRGWKILGVVFASSVGLMASELSSPPVVDKEIIESAPKISKKERKALRRSETQRNKVPPPSFEFSREPTVIEIDTIIEKLSKALSRENSIPDENKRKIMTEMVNIHSREKMKAQTSTIGYYCPAIAKSKDTPLMQKILKNPSRSVVPGIYHFSNLRERFNGILRVKDKESEKSIINLNLGKILDGTGSGNSENERRLNTPNRKGTIYFDETFNIAGISIQEVLKLIKFTYPKSPNGLSWDELPPNKFIPGLTCSFAERNFACGKDFNIFLKHLRSCRLSKMQRCASDAKESPQIREMLSEFWDYFWKDADQAPPEQAVFSETGDIPTNAHLIENKRLVEPNQKRAMLTITKQRYPNKEAFLNDDTVRENAVGIIIMEHLVGLDLSYGLQVYKRNHQALRDVMTKMVQDLATSLAKIKIELDKARVNGMISNTLTGGISREASRILDKSIDAEEKKLKEEAALREKAYKTDEHEKKRKQELNKEIESTDIKLTKEAEQKDKSDSVDKVEASRKAYEERKAKAVNTESSKRSFAELQMGVE